MYRLNVTRRFSAAHRLREYHGKCENLHGHNWKVDVDLAAPELNALGMVMDFKEVKSLVDEMLERLDHRYLNEVEPFDTLNPTTENVARVLSEWIGNRLPEGVSVKSVTCWESDDCGATYLVGS